MKLQFHFIINRIRYLQIRRLASISGWHSCRVNEYSHVMRCFSCHRYGHKASDCRDAKSGGPGPSCGQCAGTHDTKNCTTPEAVLCVNCDRHNKAPGVKQQFPTDHTVFSGDCKCYQRMRDKVIDSTNYGSA